MGPTLSVIVTLTLALLSATMIVCWGVVNYQIWRTMWRIPTARRGVELARARGSRAASTGANAAASSGTASDGPSICVVVPAHNEQAVIARLVESLVAQEYPRLWVVFALDRCTDDTRGEIQRRTADDPRFIIHEINACPADWAGKVHAIWSAVRDRPEARDADVLIFADADTWFEPSCVGAMLELMRERGLGLLSLLSTLTHDTWYERLVQPAAGFELMIQYPIIRANRDQPRRAFANGQFIMIAADAYRAMGGHEKVKDELLEDLALARLAAQHRIRAGVFLADGVVRCRMYPNWSAFRRGWKRIYTEASKRRVARLRKAARVLRAIAVLLPISTAALLGVCLLVPPADPASSGLLRSVSLALASAGLLVWILALLRIYINGHSPIWTVLGHPIGSWIVANILDEAAQDLSEGKPTVWGGKQYARPVR